MASHGEEDFACDKFAPQKWRKDVCRNCYQPARLHEKKVAKQGPSSSLTTPTTLPASDKSATLPTSVSKASTLPPGIKPPAPPKRVVSMKATPGQKPPLSGTKSGTASNIPSKPAPPPLVRSDSVPRPAQPKVFQRFQVKKEPLIDKSVPPKERTEEKEREGVRPGIVKQVADVAPSLKTNIPPEAQAVIDGQTTSSASGAAAKSDASGDRKGSPVVESPAAADSLQENDQNTNETDRGAISTSQVQTPPTNSSPLPPPVPPIPSESPQPPSVPPRPTGFELGDRGDTSEGSAATVSLNEAQTSSTTTTLESSSQGEADASPEVDQSREVDSEAKQEGSPVTVSSENDETEKREEGDEPREKVDDVSVRTQEEGEGLKPEEKEKGREEGEGQLEKKDESDVGDTSESRASAGEAKTETVEEEAQQKNGDEEHEPNTEAEKDPVDMVPSSTVEDSVATSKTEGVIAKEGGTEKEEAPLTSAQDVTDGSGEKDEGGVKSEREDGEAREKERQTEIEQPQVEATQTQATISEPPPDNDLVASDQRPAASADEPDPTESQVEQSKDGNSGKMDEEWVMVDETMIAQLEDTLESQSVSGGKEDGIPSNSPSTPAEPSADEPAVAQTAAAVEASVGETIDDDDKETKQLEEEAVVSVKPSSNLVDECSGQLVEQEVKPSTEEEGRAEPDMAARTLEEVAEDEEVKSKVVAPPDPSDEEGNKGEEEINGDAGTEGEGAVPPAGVPPPPPPPPPIGVKLPKGPPKAVEVKKRAESVRPPGGVSAHEQAMASIKGGVTLRAVPPPVQRPVGEVKVVDIASELRQRMLKQKRKEVETISSKLEAHREEAEKIAKLLRDCARTHSFVHQLRSLLATVDSFLAKCDIPPDMLAQKHRWPTDLVNDLREVISHMTSLEQKVVAAETLCKQTLLNSTQPIPSPPPRTGQTGSASPSGAVKTNGSFRGINPAAVEKCVQGVVRLAKDLSTDESRYFRAAQSYPVDISDIQGLIQRAGRSVAPLIDQMYEKAIQAHSSIFEASVTKFDQGFRVQNARRLLKMCCDMSDVLAMHLQLAKHALYSDAQLKYQELGEDFHNQLKVIERRGDWDSEEQMQLGTQSQMGKKLESRNKEDLQLVQRVVEALSSEEGVLPEEVESQLTAEVLARIELQLIKAVMAASQLKVVDSVCALKKKLYTGEDAEALLHKHDFEWLLEAVVKGNHNLLTHLIKSCGMHVNRTSTSGMSVLHRAVQRQDIPTVAHLVRLGADPLLRNAFNTTIPQMLALKCFPPSHFSDKLEEKEPLFDLTSYINNPSLSDVVLVSDDKQTFHAHRIVLCAQSMVLKTMLDSEVWAESKNKEVPLPTISSRVMQLLLKYLYTGRCLFPRDDLNLGLELMAAADQLLLEPMKVQCERALSEKIDTEVVVPLYYAAFRFNTPKLLASCRHFLLSNYGEVEDPEQEALLHVLDNASPSASRGTHS